MSNYSSISIDLVTDFVALGRTAVRRDTQSAREFPPRANGLVFEFWPRQN